MVIDGINQETTHDTTHKNIEFAFFFLAYLCEFIKKKLICFVCHFEQNCKLCWFIFNISIINYLL